MSQYVPSGGSFYGAPTAHTGSFYGQPPPAPIPAQGSFYATGPQYYQPPPPSNFYTGPSSTFGAPPPLSNFGTPPRPPAPVSNRYVFQFKGSKLDRKDIFSKSDPFLIIYAVAPGNKTAFKKKKEKKNKKKRVNPGCTNRQGDKRGWVAVHRTEVIKNSHSPVWKPFSLDLYQLCRNNLDIPILLEVWDWDGNGNHDFIGSVQSTIRELQVMKELRLVNRKRLGFSDIAGLLLVLKCYPESAVQKQQQQQQQQQHQPGTTMLQPQQAPPPQGFSPYQTYSPYNTAPAPTPSQFNPYHTAMY